MPAILALAPLAATVKAWQRLRRGSGTRVDPQDREPMGVGVALDRVVVEVDVPAATEQRACRQITELVVRTAESLGTGSTYHVVYRESGEPGCRAMPVGPQIQGLGERFEQLLSRSGLEGRTLVWLALPGAVHLGEVVDPACYDPESDGEPEGLVGRAGVDWAVAVARERTAGVSARIHLRFYVPEAGGEVVERLLDRMRTYLDTCSS